MGAKCRLPEGIPVHLPLLDLSALGTDYCSLLLGIYRRPLLRRRLAAITAHRSYHALLLQTRMVPDLCQSTAPLPAHVAPLRTSLV
jgi:hypothetical protein